MYIDVWSTYVDSSKVRYCTVPNRENDPSPEHFEIEVDSFLTCLVDLGIPVHVLIVHILLKRVGKEARPRTPQCIVEYLQPVCKEDLSREAILQREENLCEHQNDILVEVVANDPADATVAPTTMNKQ